MSIGSLSRCLHRLFQAPTDIFRRADRLDHFAICRGVMIQRAVSALQAALCLAIIASSVHGLSAGAQEAAPTPATPAAATPPATPTPTPATPPAAPAPASQPMPMLQPTPLTGPSPHVSRLDPVVARFEMQLKKGDEIIDVIHKGDLLTVVEERAETYVIRTFSGKQGVVGKVHGVKLAEAVEIYDDLIKAEPKAGRLYTLRASALWARGKAKEALEDFDSAIKLGYEEPHAFSSRGMFHASLGNYDAAIADYGMAIKLSDKDDVPYINRAAVYMTQNKRDLAIKDYDSAIKINPKKPSTYQQRAVAQKLSGNLPAAIADFDRALQVDSKHLPSLIGRGFIRFQAGEHEKAIVDFSEVIRLDPKSAIAYNNRGYNRQQLGQWKEALADYEKAIEIAGKYALSYQNKAWLLATSPDDKIRDGEEAVKAALQACELNQYKDVDDLRALAAAFAESKAFEKAIGWQEKAIEASADADKEFERKVLEHYKAEKPYRAADLEEPEPKPGPQGEPTPAKRPSA